MTSLHHLGIAYIEMVENEIHVHYDPPLLMKRFHNTKIQCANGSYVSAQRAGSLMDTMAFGASVCIVLQLTRTSTSALKDYG